MICVLLCHGSLTLCVQYNRLHSLGYLSMDPIQEKGDARLDLDAMRSRMKALDMTGT